MRKVVFLVFALAAAPAVAATEAPQPPAAPASLHGVATWGEDQKIDKTAKRDEYGGRPCGTSGTWDGSPWLVLAMLGTLIRRRT
ncbi:MAG TPA: hypothetical protein VKE22_02385 [Haliangiales bacterium]|nr:hypothetical protein [Haliangiales bacterium]